MKHYTVYLHWCGRYAQYCAGVANYPLRGAANFITDAKGKRVRGDRPIAGPTYQTKIEFDALSDAAAWDMLNDACSRLKPDEKRPIAGSSLSLYQCRESLRGTK